MRGSFFDKLFDTLADMGIWIRFNDKRTELPSEEGRSWGPAVDHFALSLARRDAETVSILIKNLGLEEVRAQLPGWLRYFDVRVSNPDGSLAALKPFGKQALSDPNLSRLTERVFAGGKYLATDMPLGGLYLLTPPGPHKVRVSCPVPGGEARLESNEIEIP